MLDLSGGLDMVRGGIWQLNPVLKEVIVDPVDEFVNTLSTLFM
jgi:hypothetical protein